MLFRSRLTHYQRLAIYVREGDALALNFQVGFPAVFDEHRARVPLPPAWQRASEYGVIESMWEPLEPDDPLGAGLRHLPLRSPRGVEGMLTVAGDAAIDAGENQALQILIHQLGTALENVHLFADLQHERNMLRGILANMVEGVFVVDEGGREIGRASCRERV